MDGALSEIDFRAWRRKIGLILQDVFLFPGSILENVRVYNDAISEEKVKEAINVSNTIRCIYSRTASWLGY